MQRAAGSRSQAGCCVVSAISVCIYAAFIDPIQGEAKRRRTPPSCPFREISKSVRPIHAMEASSEVIEV